MDMEGGIVAGVAALAGGAASAFAGYLQHKREVRKLDDKREDAERDDKADAQKLAMSVMDGLVEKLLKRLDRLEEAHGECEERFAECQRQSIELAQRVGRVEKTLNSTIPEMLPIRPEEIK